VEEAKYEKDWWSEEQGNEAVLRRQGYEDTAIEDG
jgi:hypothetical protein